MPAEAARERPIGFIGLGNMGVPMVANLVRAGHPVVAFDVSADARDRAAAVGARVVPTVQAVAAAAETIILMLPNSAIVNDVVHELAGALGDRTLLVDMSSSEPLSTRELAGRLAAVGTRLVDAPVSGGVAGAEAGRLTIMAGGEAPDVAAVEPLLGVLGRVVRVGPVGAGHAVKALNNLLSATHLWITAEAMTAGERFGLDPAVMIDVFNGSSGRSGSTETKYPRYILPGGFDSGFGLRLMLKDMQIATRLAAQVGAPSVLGEHAVERWNAAARALDPGADHTRVAAWLAER
ncbi:2-hydroxy-3-oxopropionate reductase [Tersicoccus solisilvae]|uniref:2-hydroxy-3-oxopropionate reductase n=1 Tax=Tersicoccus solisilvae TaxID=1882339 RepID=A0ABQ1PG90_9MICC|nr:NAD(P)-dependent oxidoreductase [Tersicoccus solisilvae]GGC96561.1 2-hydroxy-3-oxopropionate reductase [Tersicoccus solisilvae]